MRKYKDMRHAHARTREKMLHCKIRSVPSVFVREFACCRASLSRRGIPGWCGKGCSHQVFSWTVPSAEAQNRQKHCGISKIDLSKLFICMQGKGQVEYICMCACIYACIISPDGDVPHFREMPWDSVATRVIVVSMSGAQMYTTRSCAFVTTRSCVLFSLM